jgi:hypothetical protein
VGKQHYKNKKAKQSKAYGQKHINLHHQAKTKQIKVIVCDASRRIHEYLRLLPETITPPIERNFGFVVLHTERLLDWGVLATVHYYVSCVPAHFVLFPQLNELFLVQVDGAHECKVATLPIAISRSFEQIPAVENILNLANRMQQKTKR